MRRRAPHFADRGPEGVAPLQQPSDGFEDIDIASGEGAKPASSVPPQLGLHHAPDMEPIVELAQGEPGFSCSRDAAIPPLARLTSTFRHWPILLHFRTAAPLERDHDFDSCYNDEMATPLIPVVAAGLSLIVPGVGQLYNGERAKGLAMLVMTIGIAVSCLVFRSPATWVFMGLIYLAVMIPAGLDAYQVAGGRASRFTGNAPWYVIAMLLAVGPFALALLWRSPRFSRTAKLIWTVLVILVALLCIVTVAAVGPLLDQLLQQTPGLR